MGRPKKDTTKTTAGRKLSKDTPIQTHKDDDENKPTLPAWLVKIIAVIGVAAAALSNCSKGVGIGIGQGLGLVPGNGAQQAVEGSAVAGTEASTSAQEMVEATTEATEETALEPPVVVAEVTVTENGYIYQNNNCDLETIIVDLKEGDVIQMTDDNASKKNVDALKAAAKEKGIKLEEMN